ncbi:MAG: hypothetical protein ACSW8E_00860 [Clostridia bacterium]
MPKRWQGNSGSFSWVEPPRGRPEAPPPPPPPAPPAGDGAPPPGPLGLQLLPRLLGELETEDFILLLLCWLLYRESGDSDWLIVLAALILG